LKKALEKSLFFEQRIGQNKKVRCRRCSSLGTNKHCGIRYWKKL